ncbi:MAG: hypothetical protein RMJ43_03440 [Chloroherpetonaceae bacterium]|nr:hypothetical protein [Chloroherpetonaceae bacterium]
MKKSLSVGQRRIRWAAGGVLCVLSISVLPVAVARVQPAAELSRIQKEVQELTESVADIGQLKFLNALALTDAQLEKILAVVTSLQEEHNLRLAQFDQTALKKIAADIRTARRIALSGKPVPEELNDRINKAIDAHLKNTQKRQELFNRTLADLSQKLREILTPEQIATAARIAREETEKLKQGVKGNEAQWFNAYVQSVILGYPRIVPLLQEMRAARVAERQGE